MKAVFATVLTLMAWHECNEHLRCTTGTSAMGGPACLLLTRSPRRLSAPPASPYQATLDFTLMCNLYSHRVRHTRAVNLPSLQDCHTQPFHKCNSNSPICNLVKSVEFCMQQLCKQPQELVLQNSPTQLQQRHLQGYVLGQHCQGQQVVQQHLVEEPPAAQPAANAVA